jgi:hypothetical protein
MTTVEGRLSQVWNPIIAPGTTPTDNELTQIVAEANCIIRVSALAGELAAYAATTDLALESAREPARNAACDIRTTLEHVSVISDFFGPDSTNVLRFTPRQEIERRCATLDPRGQIEGYDKGWFADEAVIRNLARQPREQREKTFMHLASQVSAGRSHEVRDRIAHKAGVISDKIGNGGSYGRTLVDLPNLWYLPDKLEASTAE